MGLSRYMHALEEMNNLEQQNGFQRQHSGGFRVQDPRFEGRAHTSSRSAGIEPGHFWDSVRQLNYQVREVAPERRSSAAPPQRRPSMAAPRRGHSMFGPRDQPRANVAHFEQQQFQQPRATAPPQGRFPFTVFGRGRENRPDPTTRRPNLFGVRGGGGRDGQHVGNNIMKKYIVKSALKKGGMAEAINIVQEIATGHLFVQKCIPLRQRFDYKRARAEINVLLKIDAYGRHDNLNAIIESEISEARRQCFIVLEYCDMGSVSDAIEVFQRQRVHARESDAWNLMAGVASGLAFLHHGVINGRKVDGWNPICHLDLNPRNVFISSKRMKHGHGRIVLADFGCAITADDILRRIEDPAVQECGTPAYMPPEGRIGGGSRGVRSRYGPKTDIWQLGATVHVFCKLLDGPDPRYLALPRPCSGLYSDRLNRVVKLLCHPDSESRPRSLELFGEATTQFEAAVRADSGRQ